MSLPSRERGLKSTFLFLDASCGMSLPSRERGLKYYSSCTILCRRRSLPSRERGLKSNHRIADLEELARVAPFAGAWIEITTLSGVDLNSFVAPFAGAWIEMV